MNASSSGITENEGSPAGGTLARGSVADWIRQRVDSFLREDQRRAPASELNRYRVVTVAALSQVTMSVFYLGSLLSAAPLAFMTTLAAGCVVGYSAALASVRFSASSRRPGLLLCSTLACAYISAGLYMGNRMAATHVASTLIPLLAFYLLGSRGGLAFAVVMALYALILQPLALVNFNLSHPLFSSGQAISGNLFGALCILGIWGLIAMYSRARDTAQQELERTLKHLHDSERKLSSLVESTDDIVCSLDTQGNLLTANSAQRRWFSRVFGVEPRLGESLAQPRFLERHPDFPEVFARVLRGEPVRLEFVYPLGDTSAALEMSLTPISDEDGQVTGVTVFGRDITGRRQAEARLSELHRTLLETSRKAGMAEIATGVLHNVGNTLNSVNVSTSLVAEHLRGSRVQGLVRATELLQERAADLGTFLTRDERGRLLPEYLLSVSRQVAEEQATMLAEIQSLAKNVDHIKSVIHMQQEHSRFVGAVEQVALPELLDDALRLHATSLERLEIQIRREYEPVPLLRVDRHKLLQILINLLSNARHALLEGHRPDKQLTLRISRQPEERLRLEVSDNGVGIAPEHLSRIFSQGFTTKKSGHGFGLHASAQAATEMNGSLSCSSPGRGQGATFIIDLPLNPEQARA